MEGDHMANQKYAHKMTTEKLFQLLLYQANQFELFKNFVTEILDTRDIISHTEFQKLFDEYKDMNKSKFLHNLIMMEPNLDDMKIDVCLLE